VLIQLSTLKWTFGFHNVTLEAVNQGSPTFFKLRATSWVQINAELLVSYTLLKWKCCSIYL